MNLENYEKFEEMVNEYFQTHGLTQLGWRFAYINRTRVLGQAHRYKKLITFSRPWIDANPYYKMKDTVLHEIAHALVYIRYPYNHLIQPHGPEWKAIARQIGAVPESCVTRDMDIERPKGRYVFYCDCGPNYMFRRPKDVEYRCRACRKSGRYVDTQKTM